jgi:hypothetical protein
MGGNPFNTKCSSFNFDKGYITVHGGDYPNAEELYCQRINSVKINGGSWVAIPQLG